MQSTSPSTKSCWNAATSPPSGRGSALMYASPLADVQRTSVEYTPDSMSIRPSSTEPPAAVVAPSPIRATRDAPSTAWIRSVRGMSA
ncbi:MAG: hypothetical protein U0414_40655 [Polyangiaceae bacterium]